MKSGKILVIGGYGSVGKTISITLAQAFPGQVIAAGRNLKKAQTLAEETRGAVIPMEFDIFSPDAHNDIPDDVGMIVMCLDQQGTHFVEAILKKGIHYVDITANTPFFQSLEALDAHAKENHSTVLLSVGLAPGLSNLLAAKALASLKDINELDLFLLLGMGELHGEAAIRWSLENFNTTFQLAQNGQSHLVEALSDGKPTVFPELGLRHAYRFNLSDQHTLSRTLAIPSVSTRLSFDVDGVMRLLAFLKKVGALKLFKIPAVQTAYIRLTQRIRYGTEAFAVQVHATDAQGKRLRLTLYGENEARMTALATTQAVKYLYEGTFDSGVFHIEQLFDPDPFINSLLEKGLQFLEEVNP